MPNRIVRDAILTSEAVCSLGWPDEVFYRRLMSIVDDYGRHEASPQLLRSRCYPLQTDLVRVADISRWMAACQKAGLILVYEVAGKQFLQIERFGQQMRSASKCPAPPAPDISCEQPLADAHLGVFVSVDVSEGEKARKRAASPELPEGVDPQVWADWLQLRKQKRAPVTATVIDGAKAEALKAGMTLDAFLRIWCRRGSQGLEAEWLKPSERPSAPPPATTAGESSEAYLARMAAEREAERIRLSTSRGPSPDLRAKLAELAGGMRTT